MTTAAMIYDEILKNDYLNHEHLFTTNIDGDGLYQAYLSLMGDERQYYTCQCCEYFIKTYGGLVTINMEGESKSAIWNHPLLEKMISKAKVTGVYYSDESIWGRPVSGKNKITGESWTHLSVVIAPERRNRSKLKTADQWMAEKKEEYIFLKKNLLKYETEHFALMVELLNNGKLASAGRFAGPGVWLATAKTNSKQPRGNERLWRMIASAPMGYAHSITGTLGTLLEDIKAGYSSTDVLRRFAMMTNSVSYQRPKETTDGNIAVAEKLVETLGIKNSLLRRYACFEEVPLLWQPNHDSSTTDELKKGSVFGHLKGKGKASETMVIHERETITWTKFAEKILPTAESMVLTVPRGNRGFGAMVTAVDPTAPPILKWDGIADSEGNVERNPLSWYLYDGGSPAIRWGLAAGQEIEVLGIGCNPDPHESGVMMILKGCRDLTEGKSGSALFPSTLKSELHQVRSVIEKYSRSTPMTGADQATACGIVVSDNKATYGYLVTVTCGRLISTYIIDRWD